MVEPDAASGSESARPTDAPPGHFVSDEFEADCRRFLNDVRALVQRRITPPIYADESPRFSRAGRSIFFVRSRRGLGSLFTLRGERLSGPLLRIGYNLGYYGHRGWWLDG